MGINNKLSDNSSWQGRQELASPTSLLTLLSSCSGFYPAQFSKPLRVRSAQPLSAIFQCLTDLLTSFFFPLYNHLEIFLLHFMPILLSCHSPLQGAWDCLPDNLAGCY